MTVLLIWGGKSTCKGGGCSSSGRDRQQNTTRVAPTKPKEQRKLNLGLRQLLLILPSGCDEEVRLDGMAEFALGLGAVSRRAWRIPFPHAESKRSDLICGVPGPRWCRVQAHCSIEAVDYRTGNRKSELSHLARVLSDGWPAVDSLPPTQSSASTAELPQVAMCMVLLACVTGRRGLVS